MIVKFLTWYLSLVEIQKSLIVAIAFWAVVLILFALGYYCISKRAEKCDEEEELQKKIGRTHE